MLKSCLSKEIILLIECKEPFKIVALDVIDRNPEFLTNFKMSSLNKNLKTDLQGFANQKTKLKVRCTFDLYIFL